jgi:hypothetical protein
MLAQLALASKFFEWDVCLIIALALHRIDTNAAVGEWWFIALIWGNSLA